MSTLPLFGISLPRCSPQSHRWRARTARRATTCTRSVRPKDTGQTMTFLGLDDPRKHKSKKPKFGRMGMVWFEEAEERKLKEQSYDEMMKAYGVKPIEILVPAKQTERRG